MKVNSFFKSLPVNPKPEVVKIKDVQENKLKFILKIIVHGFYE